MLIAAGLGGLALVLAGLVFVVVGANRIAGDGGRR